MTYDLFKCIVILDKILYNKHITKEVFHDAIHQKVAT